MPCSVAGWRFRAAAVTSIVAAASLMLATATPAPGAVTRAESVLPPGQSGFVSVAGLATGTGSPHLYDQQPLFISFRRKNAMLGQGGVTQTPRAGVRIVRDGYGVPSVHASTQRLAWWGLGYAVAQDRLFQLETFRRQAEGRLAEILGPASASPRTRKE